jgi:hypothetical protein
VSDIEGLKRRVLDQFSPPFDMLPMLDVGDNLGRWLEQEKNKNRRF